MNNYGRRRYEQDDHHDGNKYQRDTYQRDHNNGNNNRRDFDHDHDHSSHKHHHHHHHDHHDHHDNRFHERVPDHMMYGSDKEWISGRHSTSDRFNRTYYDHIAEASELRSGEIPGESRWPDSGMNNRRDYSSRQQQQQQQRSQWSGRDQTDYERDASNQARRDFDRQHNESLQTRQSYSGNSYRDEYAPHYESSYGTYNNNNNNNNYNRAYDPRSYEHAPDRDNMYRRI